MARPPARVLFLNSRSEYGGADTALVALIRHLSPQQFSPWVILPEPGPLVADLRQAGAQVSFMSLARLQRLDSVMGAALFPFRTLISAWALRRFIRRTGIELVYTNSSAIQAGALAARLAGVPHIWHIREIWTSPAAITRPLYRFVHAFSDAVIAVSETAAQANFGRRAADVKVVYDGIDLDRYTSLGRGDVLRSEFGLPAGVPIVGAVGRIVPQKGLRCFLQAAELVSRRRDARFVIVGDVPRRRYEAYKEELIAMSHRPALEGRVLFTGWRKDVPQLLDGFTVFVLPSIGLEGLGTVIAEAWLARRAVVVPDHSGPKEMVRHNETGLLFRSGDAADLAGRILELLSDDGLRERLADAGHDDALARFSASHNAAKIQAIMLEVLATRRG